MTIPNRYDSFNFEPYVFKEFPKAIKHNGIDYIAQDSEDEKRIKSFSPKETKESLIIRAQALGLVVDIRWSVETIAEMIKTAEADALVEGEAPEFGDEKSLLIAKAKASGIEIDKRWGPEKLRSAVKEYEDNQAKLS